MLGVRIPPGLPTLFMNPAETVKDWTVRSKQFYLDVRSEMKKVSWPGKQEVMGTTIVVIVAVFFFGFYLGLIDYILGVGLAKVFAYFRG
jgi:preprotein translocase subunit SecE